MNANNPIPQRTIRRQFETSRLRSLNDSGLKQWKANDSNAAQLQSLSHTVRELQRVVERMRRTQGGGGDVNGGYPVWL